LRRSKSVACNSFGTKESQQLTEIREKEGYAN